MAATYNQLHACGCAECRVALNDLEKELWGGVRERDVFRSNAMTMDKLIKAKQMLMNASSRLSNPSLAESPQLTATEVAAREREYFKNNMRDVLNYGVSPLMQILRRPATQFLAGDWGNDARTTKENGMSIPTTGITNPAHLVLVGRLNSVESSAVSTRGFEKQYADQAAQYTKNAESQAASAEKLEGEAKVIRNALKKLGFKFPVAA